MQERLARAITQRADVRKATEALRLVDGAADGFDDLELDEFGGAWLAQTRRDESPDWVSDFAEGRSVYWKKLGPKDPPQWLSGERLAGPFVIREHGLAYWIDFAAGYSQGLFLDQRDNRLALRNSSAGRTVLNCFAYTCGFGVAAAAGGAETVNVDLSRGCLDWGRRNYELNSLDPIAHEFLRGDVGSWLRRFRKRGRCFDLIVLDPPTFSRSDTGAVFRVEAGFEILVRDAAAVLAPGGTILCATNQRSLGGRAFRDLILRGLGEPVPWTLASTPMPPDFTGEQYLKTFWVRHSVCG